ncbi:MAG: methyltransferase domain-containing protein, partial [Myxococcales bacterium]|nr:methyltransferase domain-containing protein [Myxococcales bacterium]
RMVHRITSTALLGALIVAGCGGGGQATSQPTEDHPTHERAMEHHFSSPEDFAVSWNDPARDEWQKPDEIVAALALEQGDTVADLGAGTGYLTEFLRAAVGPQGRVLALDVEPAMVEFLERHKAEAGWENVEPVLSAYDDPQLEPASVDAVVTLNTWHHIEGRTAFAQKLYDGLREGGRFVVVDFITEPTEGQGPPIEMRLAPSLVVSELEAAGFTATLIEETLPRHYIIVATRP